MLRKIKKVKRVKRYVRQDDGTDKLVEDTETKAVKKVKVESLTTEKRMELFAKIESR